MGLPYQRRTDPPKDSSDRIWARRSIPERAMGRAVRALGARFVHDGSVDSQPEGARRPRRESPGRAVTWALTPRTVEATLPLSFEYTQGAEMKTRTFSLADGEPRRLRIEYVPSFLGKPRSTSVFLD